MKQLNIFGKDKGKSKDKWELFVDGASRGNPGLAGAGALLLKNGEPIFKKGFFLGKNKTNNQAEYLALLLGLFFFKKFGKQSNFLYIASDSELLVKQIKGDYRVKNPDIKFLYSLVQRDLDNLNYSIKHVPRDKNKDADELANLGIDKKVELPKEFLTDELLLFFNSSEKLS